MRQLEFPRPVGAAADVRELEYVMALQQTCDQLRERPLISSLDILRLLTSRYGLQPEQLTHEQTKNIIMRLSGGRTAGVVKEEEEDDDEVQLENDTLHASAVTASALRSLKKHFSYPHWHLGRSEMDSENNARQNHLLPVNEGNINNNNNNIDDVESYRQQDTRVRVRRPSIAYGDNESDQFHSIRSLSSSSSFQEPEDISNGSMTQRAAELKGDWGQRNDHTNPSISIQDKGTQQHQRQQLTRSKRRHRAKNQTDQEQETYLDLVQVLAALLIPTFARMADEFKNGPHPEPLRPEEYVDDNESNDGCGGNDDDDDDDDLVFSNTYETTDARIPWHERCRWIRSSIRRKLRRWLGKVWWRRLRGMRIMSLLHVMQQQYQARINHYKYQWYDELRPRPKGGAAATVMAKLLASVEPDEPENKGDDKGSTVRYNNTDDGSTAHLPPLVTPAYIRKLLFSLGEYELVQNDDLIQQMVQVAQSPSGRLDEEAFFNAVTADLKEWSVESEDRMSTIFEDIFGTADPTQVDHLQLDDNNEENQEHSFPPLRDQENDLGNPDSHEQDKETGRAACDYFCYGDCCWLLGFVLKIVRVCWCCFYCAATKNQLFKVEPANIDMVLDAHSSVSAVALMWIFMMCTFTVFAFTISSLPRPPCSSNVSGFWCTMFQTIYSWAILAVSLSILGVILLVPLSIGNNPFRERKRRREFGIAAALIYSIVPFSVVRWYMRQQEQANAADANGTVSSAMATGDSPSTTIQRTDYFFALEVATLFIGLLLSLIFSSELIMSALRKTSAYASETFTFLRQYAATSNERAETRLKWAATRKINQMLTNAYDLHAFARLDGENEGRQFRADLQRQIDKSLRNYLTRGLRMENAGGVLWTWCNISTGSLFHTEGIWINSRLIVIQCAQVTIGAVGMYFLFYAIFSLASSCDYAQKNLDPSLPQWFKNYYPTRWMVLASLLPAWTVSACVVVLLVLIYVPSAATTILTFRCQEYSALRYPEFEINRKAVDTVYMNSGNAVYGMLGAAFLYFVLFGGIIFLFLWPPTQEFMLILLAWCIGLGVTIFIKMFLTRYCRSVQYRAFYRIRPRAAMFTSLLLECWYFGVAGSVLISRIGQFLFAAAFWVGRIDCRFLSSDVQIFGYSFDYVPIYFRKDLLLHEAHRHPFIERLAQVYLMVLRHKRFVTTAGAAWRQLAIVAYFPWVGNRRVFDEKQRQEAKKISMALAMPVGRRTCVDAKGVELVGEACHFVEAVLPPKAVAALQRGLEEHDLSVPR